MKAWLIFALVDILLFALYGIVYIRQTFRRLLGLDR